MALQAYSLARDGSTALSPHFCVREFRCKDGSDPVFIDTALAELLERIREHFGKPVTITSAYRTPAHNAKAGGAKFSQHLYGRAADIRVQDVSVEDVAAYAESLMPDRGGVGRYPVKAGRAAGWVHVDTRADKARWRGVRPMESIISAIIAGAVTLIGVLIANGKSQAVTDTKLEELTREVREHNNFARRVPILEEQMKVANHRIADLEKERN